MPASRPRAMLIAARSSGRPSRLLRSASVTNSSISLPTWRVTPRTMAPAASSGVRAARGEGERVEEGLRSGRSRCRRAKFGIEPVDRLGQHRVAEAIDRVRELGDDRRIEVDVVDLGRREEEVDLRLDRCARTPRTRDAGTASRCRTSPPGTGARRSTAARRSAPAWSAAPSTGVSSHSLRKARSLRRRATVSLVCSTSRLCSEWKMGARRSGRCSRSRGRRRRCSARRAARRRRCPASVARRR